MDEQTPLKNDTQQTTYGKQDDNDSQQPIRRKGSKVKRLSQRLSSGLRLSLSRSDLDVKNENGSIARSPHSPSPNSPPHGDTIIARLGRVFSFGEYRPRIQSDDSVFSCGSLPDESNGQLDCDDKRHVRRIASLPPNVLPPSQSSSYGRIELYDRLEALGEGSYATVYRGVSRINKMVVALKEIRLQEEEGAPFTAIREASLLKQLKHTNVVRLHDIIHTKKQLTLVFEYVRTDLCQYLECNPHGINTHNAKLFLFQLLRGLSHIHDRRILHRDLKPQNILLSERGDLKLADFGLARAKSIPSHTYSHEVVTLWYRPPDVLLGSKNYTTSLDVWGVGCIFLELLSGNPLFPGTRDQYDQLKKIFRICGTPNDETWPGVSRFEEFQKGVFKRYPAQKFNAVIPRLEDLKSAECIAEKMIKCNPRRRISCRDALKHVYFSNLPSEIFSLPDIVSIFSLPSITLQDEAKGFPWSKKPTETTPSSLV